jgi:PAS domain S-box-containing protein
MKLGLLNSVLRALARRVDTPTLPPGDEVAERERVEEALRESEPRFRTLADIVPLGIVIFQQERIVYANRAAGELFGHPSTELLGVSPWALVHPDHVELVRGRFRQRLAGDDGVPEHYEIKIVPKEGAERWVECSVAVSALEGKPAIVAALSNVTERRRSQDIQAAIHEISQAAQSAESLDELFSSLHRIVGPLMPATNFFIALHDLETATLSFPYFVDEVDAKPDAPQALGKGLTEYVLPTGTPLLATPPVFDDLCLAGAVELVGPPSVDWLGVPLKVRDMTIGVLAVQSYTGMVRYGETEREILSYVSLQAAQAIERKRAEQELRESQRKLFTLMSNLPGMAYRCANDEKWTMEFVSDGCFALTGYRTADLFGNSNLNLIVPLEREGVRRAVEQAVA